MGQSKLEILILAAELIKFADKFADMDYQIHVEQLARTIQGSVITPEEEKAADEIADAVELSKGTESTFVVKLVNAATPEVRAFAATLIDVPLPTGHDAMCETNPG